MTEIRKLIETLFIEQNKVRKLNINHSGKELDIIIEFCIRLDEMGCPIKEDIKELFNIDFTKQLLLIKSLSVLITKKYTKQVDGLCKELTTKEFLKKQL